MTRHGRWCWQSIVALVAVTLGMGPSRSSDAQNFKVIPPRLNKAQANVLGGQVAAILRVLRRLMRRRSSSSTTTSKAISIRQ